MEECWRKVNGVTDHDRLPVDERNKASGNDAGDSCDIFCYDPPTVQRVQHRLSKYDFQDMALRFKILSDETRLKIACALCIENELCVCDVANMIGSSLATASHHLRLLRNMGVVKSRKEGKLVFYSLRDEQVRTYIQLATRSAQSPASAVPGDSVDWSVERSKEKGAKERGLKENVPKEKGLKENGPKEKGSKEQEPKGLGPKERGLKENVPKERGPREVAFG